MEIPVEFEVTITSKDFAESKFISSNDCALAKALKRKFRKQKIWVGGETVAINDNPFIIILDDRFAIRNRCSRPNQRPLSVKLRKLSQ